MKHFSPTTAHKTKRESGQVIVLMALLMVILVGALGLAIDGGRMFYLWRDAQNATDASVLAAAYARCTNGDITSAGQEAARLNGFSNDGVSNTVTVNHPPVSGEKAGDKDYVEVDIQANLDPYFIQVVYGGKLEVNPQAIGYCIRQFDPTTVPALWAGATDCGVALDWTGSKAHIIGGMHSNGDSKVQGSQDGLTVEGPVSSSGYTYGDKVNYDTPPYAPIEGAPVQEFPLSYLKIDDYKPGGKIAISVPLYHSIEKPFDDSDYSDNGKGDGTWKPMHRTIEGMYYVYGDVVIGNSVSFGSKGVTVIATGTIDMQNPEGISYYNEAVGPDGGGILAYTIKKSKNCGEDVIHISASDIQTPPMKGVLVAPEGGVGLSAAKTHFIGAIFAYTINLSGSDLLFEYDPNMLPAIPPSVQIAQ